MILRLITLLCLLSQATQAKNPPLVVGLTGQYPPFNYFDDSGKLTGFDVEVARELCERISRPCEFLPMPWDGILSALLAKRIDVIIGSMAVTETRAQQVRFTRPYYESGAQLFLRPDITDPTTPGTVIGVTLGTTYGEFARQKFPRAQVRTFKGDIDVFQDIQRGRVQGILTDRLVGSHLKTRLRADVEPHGPLLYEEKIAIPVHPDQPELLRRLDSAVEDLRASPRYAEIYAKYFGQSSARPREFSWGTSLGLLFRALLKTVWLSSLGLALGVLLAGMAGALVLLGPTALRVVVQGAIDFIRATPFMVQLFALYFGLPAAGFTLDPWSSGILAIALHSSAYLAVIFVGAYRAIPQGQHDAAHVLGLGPWQRFRHVLGPQMLPLALPPSLSTLVAMIKDSAVVSVISVHELMLQTQQLIAGTFRPMAFYLLAAALYFLVTYPLLLGGQVLERHFRRKGLLHG